ncbi:MAG: DUF2298 domain-containing protein, partial [Dehalococcoidia bacterium]
TGLTFAVKQSALPLVVAAGLAYLFRLLRRQPGGPLMPSLQHTRATLAGAALAAGTGLLVLFATSPYIFLDWGTFLANNLWETEIARTAGKMPYTIQYIGTTPFWYEIRNSAVWGLGLPLGIAAWGGLLFALGMAIKRRQPGELLLLAWVLPLFLTVGLFEVKFMRYSFPILPVLVLFGARLLLWLVDRARTLPWRRAALGLTALVVFATAFYGLAFVGIFSRPHTATQASQWIQQNVPPGSTILGDNHWDEGLPNLGGYRVRQLPMYEGDSPAKMQQLADDLAQGDYLYFYSNRTYGSIARVPQRYPWSAQYYQQLFTGELGYELERAFTSYPSLLGVAFAHDTFTRSGLPAPEGLERFRSAPLTLNLGYADENAVNYGHPLVLLFKNNGRLSQEALSARLLQGTPPEPTLGLMLSAEELAAQRQGGTWSEIIRPRSWTNRVPVLAWLLLVELISLAALPLAFLLFRPLPDRGYLLSKLLGILGVSYIAWLLASLGWMTFSRASVLAGLLLLGGLSALVLAYRWREMAAFVRQRWRLLLTGEAVFLVAFLVFLLIRAANPDLWHPFRGGEKPMDFAYLNAILKSSTMPPYDPWFAGGSMNYYYFGHFIVATLIKATGIVPAVAYNLAVPLVFGLTAAGAFSLAYNLAEGSRQSRSQASSQPGSEEAESGAPRAPAWSALVAGGAGALFVVALSNLDGLVQLVQGAWTTLVEGGTFPAFDYWRSSRMMPPQISITEFPFFTFLFADLHAHMLVIPFTLLALGLALSLLLSIRRGPLWPGLLLVPVLALAVGSLAAINTWDFPTYLGIALVALAIGYYLRAGSLQRRAVTFVVVAGAVVGLSFLWLLPFHLRYQTFESGLELTRWQTPFYQYLAIHGLFLFLGVSFLLHQLWRPLKLTTWATAFRSLRYREAGEVTLQGVKTTLVVLPALAAGGLLVYLGATGFDTLAVLLVLLGLTVFLALRRLWARQEETPWALFPLLLLGSALFIGILVDLVRVQNDIDRMNTVFKLYLQAWVLFGLASAYALWHLVFRSSLLRFHRARLAKGVWAGLLALFLVGSLLYTGLGTRSRLQDRFAPLPLTLDGTAYMQDTVYEDYDTRDPLNLRWDYEAIRWLQENVTGSPVVLEAARPQYRWGARISIYTGLPTVVGWPWHQEQQRGPYSYAVNQRFQRVGELYATPDRHRALELLREYDVAYMYVGELERVHYPAAGLAKFDEMAQEGTLTRVYTNPGVTIYQVTRGEPLVTGRGTR